MSVAGPGCVKTPTLNLRVEFLSQFRRCGNRLHRDSFCEKTIEKTILCVLGSSEFSHSLDPLADIGYLGRCPLIACARAPAVMRPSASAGRRARTREMSVSTSP